MPSAVQTVSATAWGGRPFGASARMRSLAARKASPEAVSENRSGPRAPTFCQTGVAPSAGATTITEERRHK
jgi:hypothetical protein